MEYFNRVSDYIFKKNVISELIKLLSEGLIFFHEKIFLNFQHFHLNVKIGMQNYFQFVFPTISVMGNHPCLASGLLLHIKYPYV